MFLYKNNRIGTRIRLYKHRCIGLYEQDLIVFSTYVI